MFTFNRLQNGDEDAVVTKDLAISATRNIASASNQAWMLADIAEKWAKTGNREPAKEIYDLSLELSQSIKNAWGRARVLAKLSQALMALVEAGEFD
jgi:hypothetical protein